MKSTQTRAVPVLIFSATLGVPLAVVETALNTDIWRCHAPERYRAVVERSQPLAALYRRPVAFGSRDTRLAAQQRNLLR